MKKRNTGSGTTVTIPSGPAAPNPTPNIGIPALVAGDETATILAAIWSEPLVIVNAAPGAGKTYRATAVAAHLTHQGKQRVVVATSTRAQAADFANRLAAAASAIEVRLVMSIAAMRTDNTDIGLATATSELTFTPEGHDSPIPPVLVTTTAKLAVSKDLIAADVLIIDEAYQCTFSKLTEISSHAKRILCIGDPGQIDPINTVDTERFAEQTYAPHKSAPEVLLAARPDDIVKIELSATRRIGPETTKLIDPLYPFNLTSLRPPSAFHTTLNANPEPEYVTVTVQPQGGTVDPTIVDAIVEQVDIALNGFIKDSNGLRPVSETDIAIVAPHVAQTAAIAVAVPNGVLVTTADRVQGLERDIVIAHDPLAGQIGCPEFNLNLGRLCVVLSRARAHLRWVTTTNVTPALKACEHPDAELNATIRQQLAA